MADISGIRKDNTPSQYLFSGMGFLVLWVMSQSVPTSKVFHFMDMAVEHWDSGYILASGVVLVIINSTRAISLYLGWFLFGEGMARFFPKRSFSSWLIPLFAIPLSYLLISSMGRGIVPHFGIPAVLSVASVLILHYMTREVSGWFNKAIALALFIFSFQWFDIIPLLTPYGAGWGELSMSLKELAILMEREMVLNISGFIIFSSLFLGGVITSELMVAYSYQLKQMALLSENEKNLARLREENIRNRGAVELQQLVHDLKRPLTTITGLTDVILALDDPGKMICHTGVISKAAGNMNDMISEILHANARRNILFSEFLDYTLNQISPFGWKDNVFITADQGVLSTEISINLVRLSRALVNLLDNSRRAVSSKKDPLIEIRVSADNCQVTIIVTDNGPGFGPEGYIHNCSGWNSTGIGLGFVKQVIDDHGGQMTLSDGLDGGAIVTLRLPR